MNELRHGDDMVMFVATAESNVDGPFPLNYDAIVVMLRLFPQKRVPQRIDQHIVDVFVPQLMEVIVEVCKIVLPKQIAQMFCR